MKKKLLIMLFGLMFSLSACGVEEENLDNQNQTTRVEKEVTQKQEVANIEIEKEESQEVSKPVETKKEENQEVITEETFQQNSQENITFVLNENEILTFRTTATVNVRKQPNTTSEVYKKLSVGTKVEGSYFNEEWCGVKLDNEVFFISRSYLKEYVEGQENGRVIVIDPGHQLKGNSNKEPVGPGASEKKAKVTSGTAGKTTGIAEYEINLEVGLKLRDELESRGYQVIMTREVHEVDMSNSERAMVANNANADAFVRIHANGSENTSVTGMMTICQTSSNPYNANLYKESKQLSECILDSAVEATGAKKQYVWETDTMSGINWAMVPSTIVEMGYMSNKEEEQKLVSDEYQHKIVIGIANGIDNYFAHNE